MTFYHQQILSIKENIFPKENLCSHVIQAKNYIEKNFANKITLQDIAGNAYCSKFHFLRLFKSLYGRTPHQYLTETRIAKAKQLLQSGLPAADVCFSVGFDSISSFKALFKRNTGFTPSGYRKQLKDKQEISATPFRFLPFFFSLKKSNIQDS
ncbi:MAG TPA: AraC family transcriptional regulator [Chitinophagaceae bacterium]|nr:AraC family transcriptional regulator [Chitinophagaceae bacterium]